MPIKGGHVESSWHSDTPSHARPGAFLPLSGVFPKPRVQAPLCSGDRVMVTFLLLLPLPAPHHSWPPFLCVENKANHEVLDNQRG